MSRDVTAAPAAKERPRPRWEWGQTGGPHPPGGAGAGALHPIPQGIPQGAPRGRGSSSPTLPSISLSSAMASGWQLQNSLQREKKKQPKPPRNQHLLPKIPSLPAGTTGWKGEQTLPCWHQSKDWSKDWSKPGELCGPSQCSAEPLKELQDVQKLKQARRGEKEEDMGEKHAQSLSHRITTMSFPTCLS